MIVCSTAPFLNTYNNMLGEDTDRRQNKKVDNLFFFTRGELVV